MPGAQNPVFCRWAIRTPTQASILSTRRPSHRGVQTADTTLTNQQGIIVRKSGANIVTRYSRCAASRVPPVPPSPWAMLPRCGSAFIEIDRLLLALEDSALHPVGLLWPLLTSPAPSRPVARAVVRCSGQSWRSLEVRRAFFSRTRRIYPHGVPNDDGASPSLAGLPAPHWPYIRLLYVASEVSSSAFFRSRLATGTLA